MDEPKKKRGRKPKNCIIEEIVNVVEKKKRGRKKKYEIENFERILNRNEENNFNHNIIYSDDEINIHSDEKTQNCVKKISFGNLDITVSKKVENENVNNFKFKTRLLATETLINKDEYSSDEDKEVPLENFIKSAKSEATFGNEKVYSEQQRYVTKSVSECTMESSVKKFKVITTTKDEIKSSTEWPNSCNTCCWWCCHTFKGSPCTMPVTYDPHRKRYTFIGLFCSWNCVKSYNFDKGDYKKYERSTLITLLVQQLYNVVEAINIKPAPPRQTLKMFGGYLDIESFRNPSNIDGYKMNLINFNYIHPEITEITNVKMKTEKKNLRLARPT